jgi:hypothetical protein
VPMIPQFNNFLECDGDINIITYPHPSHPPTTYYT